MKSLFVNSVRLLGNVGLSPEVKHFENGTTVARVRLATNESYKDKRGEKVEITEWHTLTFWGKKVEIIENYVSKGDRIMVEGKLKYGTYTDNLGTLRYTTEIEVNDFQLLPKANAADKNNENVAVEASGKNKSKNADKLPF